MPSFVGVSADVLAIPLDQGFPSLELNFMEMAAIQTMDPRVTFTRASNATMFDSQGRLVWAPANMVAQSTTAGAVLGVLGSGGSLPTNWQGASLVGVTREVVAIGTDYVDVRYYGTNTSGSIGYPHIYITQLVAVVNGADYRASISSQVVAGSLASFSGGGRLSVQWFNGSTYVSEQSASPVPTSVLTRVSSSGAAPAAGVTNYRATISMTTPIAAVVDVTLRLSNPQVELNGVDSPKPYIPTPGTAVYNARLDFNPATLAARGLLIEEARTNLAPYSAHAGLLTGIVPQAGSMSAGPTYTGNGSARYTGDGTVGTHLSYAGFLAAAPAISTQHTVSVELCASSNDLVQLALSASYSAADCYINFRMSTGTIVSTGAGASNTFVTSLGGGVYRVGFTFTTPGATAAAAGPLILAISAAGDTRAVSFAYSGTIDWRHAQLEVGAFATSYIPTFGAAATRAADQASITGTNFSSWYRQDAGTFVVDSPVWAPNDGVNSRRILDISDGSTNNRIQATRPLGGTSVGSLSSVAGVSDFNPATAAVLTPGLPVKFSYSYTAGRKAICANGGAVVTSALNIPASGLIQMVIGNTFAFGATNSTNNWISRIRYWPRADFTDAQLQALST